MKLLHHRTRRVRNSLQLASQHLNVLPVLLRIRQFVRVDYEIQRNQVRSVPLLNLRSFLIIVRIHLLESQVIFQELHRAFRLTRTYLERIHLIALIILYADARKTTVVMFRVRNPYRVAPLNPHRSGRQPSFRDKPFQRITFHVITHLPFLRQRILLSVIHQRFRKGNRIVRLTVHDIRLDDQSRITVTHACRNIKRIVRHEQVTHQSRRLRFRLQFRSHAHHQHLVQPLAVLDAHINLHPVIHLLQYRLVHSRLENQRSVIRYQNLVIPVLIRLLHRFPFEHQHLLRIIAVQQLLDILCFRYRLDGIYLHRDIRKRHLLVSACVIHHARHLYHLLSLCRHTASGHHYHQRHS